MSEAKHTPGPWQWTQHFDPTISIYKDGFGQIARLYDSSAGTGKANARLIAAAPDLLAACEFVLAHAFERKWDEDGRAFTMISSALRKATGGSA